MAEKNWRRAYHHAVDAYITCWRRWRHEAPSTRIRTPGMLPNYTAGQMRDWSDGRIVDFAREVAAKDMERAINKDRMSA